MIRKSVKYILKSELLAQQLLKNDVLENNIYYVSVDPKKITHISIIPESSPFISGPNAVIGFYTGLFDYLKFPFEKHFMFKTVAQMQNGIDWRSTPYYRKLLKLKPDSEAIVHLEKLRNIIEILSTEGYLSQYELGKLDKTQNIAGWDVPSHETIIGLDRQGRLFRLKGGRHRLAVAQNIGITEMPAILTMYHKNAVQFLPEKKRVITGKSVDFKPFV